MGGKLRDGLSLVGGVVTDEIKEMIDAMVRNGQFPSRSKAIGHIISVFFERDQRPTDNEQEDA